MFDTSPGNLLKERKAAEAVRDVQLRSLRRAINLLTGPHSHAKSDLDSEYWPDNFVGQYVTLMLPKAAHTTPRASVRMAHSAPDRILREIQQRISEIEQAVMQGLIDPGLGQAMMQKAQMILQEFRYYGDVAQALEYGINRWFVVQKALDVFRQVVVDSLLLYGVLKTVQQRDPASGRSLPRWERVPQQRFGFDPLCMFFGQARYVFQDVIEDRDALLQRAQADPEAGWNLAMIQSLTADSEARSIRERSKQDEAPPRNEVAFCEFWVREDLPESPGPEHGFHGTIYTVALTGGGPKDDWLRKPTPYYGPACGPYELIGVYPVPDSAFPLSPVMMNLQQAESHNDQVKAAIKAARNYKRVVFVPAGDPTVSDALVSSPHDYVIQVKGFKKEDIVAIEIAGLTDQQLKQIMFSRELLRRSSGLTDPNVGQAVEGATATADAIAEEAAGARMVYVQQSVAEGAARGAYAVAWYLYHDSASSIPLDADAAEELNMIRPSFRGGVEDGRKPEFDKVALRIDMTSMGLSNQNRERETALQLFDRITQIGPVIANTPEIRWVDALNRLGDPFNRPDLGDLIDEDAVNAQRQLKQMADQLQLQTQRAGVQDASPGQGAGRPASTDPNADRNQQARQRGQGRGLPGNRSGALAGAQRSR